MINVSCYTHASSAICQPKAAGGRCGRCGWGGGGPAHTPSHYVKAVTLLEDGYVSGSNQIEAHWPAMQQRG
jgi:hypothetical protein